MEYKTNVMRILDKMKVEYKSYSYVNTDAISGIDVANILNQNANQVFKTLVKNYNLMNNSKLFRTNLCRKYQEE
jgi:prolyl-tRNA editing enzyme YbaK/EbsC (Cys-tRNA(Pro) deacylase)